MTNADTPLQVISAIICDDVRREINGKDILIGVFGSGMKIGAIPSLVSLSFWLELYATAGSHELTLRMIDPNGATVFQTPTNKVETKIDGFNHSAIVGAPIQISLTGDFKLQINTQSGEWQTIRTLNIISDPSAFPIVAQPI